MRKFRYTFLMLLLLPLVNYAQYTGGVGRGDGSSAISGKYLSNYFYVPGNWSITSSWKNAALPTSYEAAVVKAAATVDGAYSYPNLTIEATGSVTISPGKSLTITGTLTNNAGTSGLVIQSTSEGTGSLIFTSGTPNATAKRYIVQDEWHLVTPITIPSTAFDFYLGGVNRSWLAYYDEGSDTYPYIIDENASLSRATGYSYWIETSQGAQTIEFTGTLIGTDVAATLAKATNGWNLIGNPFSSALDWTSVSVGNTTGTAYVWDNSAAGYLYSSGTLPSDIIPLGQGFFVQASEAGSFTIPAAARAHSMASFIKSANANRSEPSQFIRLDLDGGYYGNTVFVGFPDFGTDDFDISGDATKLYSTTENVQFFAIENDKELCVNANAPLTEGESKTVPLNLVQVTDGEYTLVVSDLDQLENTSVTLEDLKTGNTQDLRASPTYLFSAYTNDNPERFLLHFALSPDGLEEDFEQASNIQIYSYGKEVYIRSTNDAINQNGNVFIYDLMGRELAQQKIAGGKLIKIPVNTANNYVVVKVVKASSTKIQKVFIK